MHTSPVMACQSSESAAEFPAMPLPPDCAALQPAAIQPASSGADLEIKRAIRDLLDVLPKDVLDELNRGTIDYKDPAFLDGLTDHVSRLSLASPQDGRKTLGKIIRLKKLIARNLRESDPELAVSATITRSGTRVGRNDTCPCGSGKKYKQCCLRKQ